MTTRTLPLNRSRTSLDQQREAFEKSQLNAISKAVSELEAPVKVKHVRSAIIGTFQEKGCNTFWSIVRRLPIHSNSIMAWKFCHTLHKVLREGHPNVLKGSQKHVDFLKDIGSLWEHVRDGYGKLIFLYFKLLGFKLDFHRRNPKFPGNLYLKDEELELVCENDINLYFQLSVELLDYMDEILGLQAAIFGSLDMSKSNSMTSAGQCRLAPLICCIQDSSLVYDYLVKLLFKLHNCLPPDTLEGHRTRFIKQFKALRQFYIQSSMLQYFKTLIQIPTLEENPPNFLIFSELKRHVTPVVVVPSEDTPQHEVDEPLLVQLDSDTLDRSVHSSSPDLLAERDRYIEHLLHQIEQLTAELNSIRHKSYKEISSLQRDIAELRNEIFEKTKDFEEAIKEREELEMKLNEAALSSQAGSLVELQMAEHEKRAKSWEEKFTKLKEVYQKLREEHIALLRQKAETDKKLLATKAVVEQNNKAHTELQDSMEKACVQVMEYELELERFKEVEIKQGSIETENSNLRDKIKELEKSISNEQKNVSEMEAKVMDLIATNEDLTKHVEELTAQVTTQTTATDEIKKGFDEARRENDQLRQELALLQTSHEAELNKNFETKASLEKNCIELQDQTKALESRYQDLVALTETQKTEKEHLESKIFEAAESEKRNFELIYKLKEELSEAQLTIKTQEENFIVQRESNESLIAGLKRQFASLKEETASLQNQYASSESRVRDLENMVADQQNALGQMQEEQIALHKSHKNELEKCCSNYEILLKTLLDSCFSRAYHHIQETVANLAKDSQMANVVPILELSSISCHKPLALLENVRSSLLKYAKEKSTESICQVIPLIFPLAESIAFVLLHGRQLSNNLPDLQKSEELIDKCAGSGSVALKFFTLTKQELHEKCIDDSFIEIKQNLEQLQEFTEALIETIKSVAGKENVGEQLEEELANMERTIEEAAGRMALLLDNSKNSLSGVKLEVHEKVLDSSSALMKAIADLIRKSKVLQEEIVARSKGSSSAKEFYKRNHRWTEGLLSAAKAVGFGAKLLMDAADKVVQGHGKFEQLTVASQEIAASTAQLVCASRVKAEPRSKSLQALGESSKAVSLATGNVVATAKHCSQLVEDSDILDFTHLTLHQAKRLEMESQVKVLELESLLEKERFQLGALRKQHYQLAGESVS